MVSINFGLIVKRSGHSISIEIPLEKISNLLPDGTSISERDLRLMQKIKFMWMDPKRAKDDLQLIGTAAALFLKIGSEKAIDLLCRRAGIKPEEIKEIQIGYVGRGSNRVVHRVEIVSDKVFDFAVSIHHKDRILSTHSADEMRIFQEYHARTYVLPEPFLLSRLGNPPLCVMFREYLDGDALKEVLLKPNVDFPKLAAALGNMFANFINATEQLPGDMKHDHTIINETPEGYSARICDVAWLEQVEDKTEMIMKMWMFLERKLQSESAAFWGSFFDGLAEETRGTFAEATKRAILFNVR